MSAYQSLSRFGDERLDRRLAQIIGQMVARGCVCLRQLAEGARHDIVGFGRFLSNERVTVDALIEGWGEATSRACEGRHILAIQDTSEINFTTTAKHRRGLGEIGKGNGCGLLLHPMLAVDAESGNLLGLVAGRIWTRTGRIEVARAARLVKDKEIECWLSTGEAAKSVLAAATMVTEVSDRESDFYAKWASLPEPGFHILTRARHDRPVVGGGKLSTVAKLPAGEAVIELRAQPGRPARTARLVASFAQVEVKRPKNTIEKGLAKTVAVSVVEVAEVDAAPGVKPIFWRLLTTHPVEDAAMAWQVIGWYRQRWIIEQFFRTLKLQGLRLEDSQLESADRLLKLSAMAASAACEIMQLVQARDGKSGEDARIVFTPPEIETLHALVRKLEGKTALQKNPHRPESLAWAAWVIAKLGGWDGYPRSKPPGPITFRNGLEHFKSIAQGWTLRDV